MNLCVIYVAALATGILGVVRPAVAQAQTPGFLPPAQAIRLIADGRPWTAQSAEGKTMKMTLNKDGSGSAQGPMPFALPISWEVKGEAICLNVGPAGTKCVKFRQVDSGYEGWNGSKLDLKLRR
jgi:hypothetical protein